MSPRYCFREYPVLQVLLWAVLAVAGVAAAVPAGDASKNGADVSSGAVPLINAHAHNDYRHPRPLLDALEHGFCSVEVDIHLVDGELLVAHNPDETDPAYTLEALYLKPLLLRVRENGGAVYRGGPEFTLLIDQKTEAESTYRVLRVLLERYAEMLTADEKGKAKPGAVRVVMSGNRPWDLVLAEESRLVGIDARPDDLDRDLPAGLIPLMSQRWSSLFKWTGAGPMPDGERDELAALVRKAHEKGARVRFWATPENPLLWKTLLDAGVDLINTDRLDELRGFLLDRGGPLGRLP